MPTKTEVEQLMDMHTRNDLIGVAHKECASFSARGTKREIATEILEQREAAMRVEQAALPEEEPEAGVVEEYAEGEATVAADSTTTVNVTPLITTSAINPDNGSATTLVYTATPEDMTRLVKEAEVKTDNELIMEEPAPAPDTGLANSHVKEECPTEEEIAEISDKASVVREASAVYIAIRPVLGEVPKKERAVRRAAKAALADLCAKYPKTVHAALSA